MAGTQDQSGQTIGNYGLLRRLGQGNFGTVYLAQHLLDHAQVAMKILPLQQTNDYDLRTFLNEARTIRLRHPHIIPVLDFGLSRNNLPFLVMEYAEGGTLRDRHPRETKLPELLIDTYVQQIASALQYAHDHQVIHRDVKPENVLIRQDGTVQLSDFGIAKLIEQGSSRSMYSQAGTPLYMSPEQSQGHSSPASDQYALAVMAYEWFCGRSPFQGGPLEVMLQHRLDAPPPPHKFRPDISPEVEQVLLKAMSKMPEMRFPTVTHFAQALHAALGKERVTPFTSSSGVSADPTPELMSLEKNSQLPTIDVANKYNASDMKTAPLQDKNGHEDTPFPSRLSEMPFSTRTSTTMPRPGNHLRLLLAIFCLVLLLGGGATWLFTARQSPLFASNRLTPTAHASSDPTSIVIPPPIIKATPTPTPTPTPEQAYWAGTAQGVGFGFDANHTHTNPYEQTISTTNISHVTRLWSYSIPIANDQPLNEPTPTIANSMLFVGSGDKHLYAFDATCRSACQPLWSYKTGDSIDSSPAIAHNMLYIGSNDGTFYAFDATCRSSCQPLWSYKTGQAIHSSATVAGGIVYIGSDNAFFYAFDATCRNACQPLWSYKTGASIASSPAIANGIVYIGSNDTKLYAFDATCRNTCQPLWSYKTGGFVVSSPAIANGIVYVGSQDSALYAFDATCRSTCQPLWSYKTGDIQIDSSPAVANGEVYIAGDSLYVFDATCRKACLPLWTYQDQGLVFYSSPSIANGVVYIGAPDGKLDAFDATCRNSCQPIGSFVTGKGLYASPVIANGVVYIDADDGNLYAFGLTT